MKRGGIGGLLLLSALALVRCRDYHVPGPVAIGNGGSAPIAGASPMIGGNAEGGGVAGKHDGGALNSAGTSAGSTSGGMAGETDRESGTAGSSGGAGIAHAGARSESRAGAGAGGHIETGAPSEGGVGGQSGESGAAGAPFNPDGIGDDFVPTCVSAPHMFNDFWPAAPMADIGVSRVAVGIPFQVYATIPAENTAVFKWRLGFSLTDPWTGWLCFDLVPHANRIAAINLQNGREEVYATSEEGSLFVRRALLNHGWTQWTTMQRPSPTARVTDLALAIGADVPLALAVTTSEGAFIRYRVSKEPYAAYGDWLSISDALFERVAACSTEGPKTAFFLQNGILHKGEFAPGLAALPERVDWADSTALLDIECTRNATGSQTLYATRSNGALVRWVEEQGDTKWSLEILRDSELHPKLSSLAAGMMPGEEPHLFAIDAAGVPWFSHDGGLSWILQP